MPKFSKQLEEANKNAPGNASPIQTTTGRTDPTTLTATGGAGWEREAKGELFLLAVTNMVGEQTFHEASELRDQRYVDLIHQVSKEDPYWMFDFVPWLRNEANMRSASLVAAVEYGRATVDSPAGSGTIRMQVVDAACQRADEPGEMLAYYWATNGGRRIVAKWLQRGLSMAAKRLYTERSVLKYDTPTHIVRMADVMNMCRPDSDGENVALFDYILHRRQGHKPLSDGWAQALPIVAARQAVEAVAPEDRRLHGTPETLREAGVTWEYLSSWLPGGMDAQAWEAVIPTMGYMALLRNLRNFDQAGVSQTVKEKVAAKLSDPSEVARSRQFPFRFLSAYKNVESDYWKWPLEQAVNHSLKNVEGLDRPLILVDISPSMFPGMSRPDKNGNHRYELAALFGTALAMRSTNPTLVAYDSPSQEVHIPAGSSVLKQIERFRGLCSPYGGTETFQALHCHYRPGHHQSVVILTDEQSFASHSTAYRSQYNHDYVSVNRDPAEGVNVPIYNFNLAGYKEAHMASGNGRYSFGGLTDQGFKAIAAIQRYRTVGWPWETEG